MAVRTGGLGVLPGGALAAGCELFVRHVTPVTHKRNVLVQDLTRLKFQLGKTKRFDDHALAVLDER